MRRKSKRHSPLMRALDLLVELSSRRYGMDYAEIMSHLGTGRRNMYRYLDALERAGVKLERRREPIYGRAGGNSNCLIRLVDIRGFKLTQLSA